MSDHQMQGESSEDEVQVKVTDRRKFDSQGQRREDADPVEGAAEEAAATPPPTTPPETKEQKAEPRAPKPAPAATPDSGNAASTGEGPATGGGESQGQVDFQSFVYFLYMSALHELGIPTQPEAQPRPADLERARFFVDVLQILEGKTKGNLEPGEAKLLEEALYNLRMQYVAAAKAPQKSS